jgi:hypothetical protein
MALRITPRVPQKALPKEGYNADTQRDTSYERDQHGDHGPLSRTVLVFITR